VAQEAPRWLEITPSQFPHEAEGLARIHTLLPDAAPFRAWSNFEFRDGHGKWHEVDLLVLGRRRLHLVELKAYRGTLHGDDHRWRRADKRAEDSPLKLARRKAQRLASKLQDELLRWAKEHGHVIPDVRDVVPFVQESVYLHHEQFRCELPPSARIDLFGLDGQTATTNLPGIRDRLLEPASGQQTFKDAIIAQLMRNIGVVQRRQREAGSWVIDEEPTDEGDGWQDWPAFHRVSNDRARIHFLVTAPGAATAEIARTRTLGQHEYRVMQRLQHEGLLSPRDIVDNNLGVGLVYPADERFQRLDLWLADRPQGIPVLTQLAILRKVAETVAYAHDNSVVHRGLTPHAVHVRETVEKREIKVLVGDWQSAGTTRAASTTAGPGDTGLLGAEQPSTAAERLHAVMNPADADRRAAEAFQAPEGVWNTQAQRVPLDVFALGALAYFVLAGRAAAPDRAALRERVRRDGGLDLSADLPQVTSAVRALVLEATRPAVSERLADVPRFLELLAAAERSLTAAPDDDVDALDAAPGAVLAGRFELVRRLGAGSTAVGLLVVDHDLPESGDRARVLKVALHDAAATRLAAEAEVLHALSSDPRVARLVEGPIQLGARQALVLESAGEETLSEVLRGRARLSLDLLERWGADLLLALAALDKAGVDHRDIKPANLGVRKDGRGRKGLVLFDFSLSRAGASAVTAGTPPYLDPFLELPGRGRYDSAAERYSAAVVLFEMSTGTAPVYGDGFSDPASVQDEATITPAMFDPSAAPGLQRFFTTALAREAAARFDTAAEMLAAWRSVFTPLPTTVPDDADTLVDAVEASTALTASGLSARALSALEPYGVQTVGELVALDPVRLNRLSGVAEPTRKEVKARYSTWRTRLGRTRAATPTAQGDLPDPITAAERLVATVGSARAEKLRAAASKILGLDGTVDAFANQQEIATASGVTRARIAQQIPVMQTAWSQDDVSRTLLDTVLQVARDSLANLGTTGASPLWFRAPTSRWSWWTTCSAPGWPPPTPRAWSPGTPPAPSRPVHSWWPVDTWATASPKAPAAARSWRWGSRPAAPTQQSPPCNVSSVRTSSTSPACSSTPSAAARRRSASPGTPSKRPTPRRRAPGARKVWPSSSPRRCPPSPRPATTPRPAPARCCSPRPHPWPATATWPPSAAGPTWLPPAPRRCGCWCPSCTPPRARWWIPAPSRSPPPGSTCAWTPTGSTPAPPRPQEPTRDSHPRADHRPQARGADAGGRPASPARVDHRDRRTGQDAEGPLAGGPPRRADPRPHLRVLGGLAGRPHHPGRGGLGAHHRLRPLLRGQHPRYPGVDHGTGPPQAGSTGRRARLLPGALRQRGGRDHPGVVAAGRRPPQLAALHGCAGRQPRRAAPDHPLR